jgi:hypothetical protein
LDDVLFTDFARLQRDRLYFWKQAGDGDPFLYRLGEAFARRYPLPHSGDAKMLVRSYEERISIGEAFRNPHKGFNPPTDAIYQVIGNYLLGQVALSLEQVARAKIVNLDDSDSQRLIQRLNDSKVYLQIEDTEQHKFFKNILSGKFGYLQDRLAIKVSEHPKRWFCIFLVAPCALAVLLFALTRRFKPTAAALVLGGILAFLWVRVLLSHVPSSQSPTTGSVTANALRLRPFRQFQRLGNDQQFAFEIMLVRRGQELVGSSFWFNRRTYRAAYLATDVPREYPPFLQANRVALVMAGGFTNSLRQPEGLTLQSGNLVNSVLMPDRHALVLVEPSGGIRVLSLRQAQVELPLGANKTKTIENPLNSLLAYAELLDWCRTRNVTMFQTQLLAFSDRLMIDPGKAKPELRERRILSLVSQESGSGSPASVHHVIFNIVAPCKLADIAAEIFATLKKRKMKVEALLNLDVGAFNILQTFDDHGAPLSHLEAITGRTHDLLREQQEPASGTNLLVYIQ